MNFILLVSIVGVFDCMRVSHGFVNYSQIKNRHRRQESGICQIPINPPNGEYVIGDDNAHNYKPRDYVGNLTLLFLRCNKQFKPIPHGLSTSVCLNGSWAPLPNVCARTCKTLLSTAATRIECNYNYVPLEICDDPVEGTVAHFSCEPYYENFDIQQNPFRLCLDGEWDGIPQCFPICGEKRPAGITNLINGTNVTMGEYPWHVAFYNDKKMYQCGGSIISQRIIVFAAHCFSDANDGKAYPKENYLLAAGKYYSKYDDARDLHPQYLTIKAIHIPTNYRGVGLQHETDIAVIVLSSDLVLSEIVQPVCVDWATQFEYSQLSINQNGTVLGWGYTREGHDLSDELKELSVPFIPFEQCYEAAPQSFKKYIHQDKICGGYLNSGKSVCGGDSGGGLVFLRQSNGRYYLRGIVSASPSTDVGHCNSQQYGLYTRISICPIPSPQLNGGYVILPTPKIEDFASPNSYLTIICEKNYSVSPSDYKFSTCSAGVWNPQLPNCSRKCGSLNSTATTQIQCSLNSKILDSCNDPLHGTLATVLCAEHYELAKNRSSVAVCQDGDWDSIIIQCLPSEISRPQFPLPTNTSGIQEDCPIPSLQSNGKYIILPPPKIGNKNISSGDFASPNSYLTITCERNYGVNPSDFEFSTCSAGIWSPQLPNCSRYCENLNSSATTEIQCSLNNRILESCNDPLHGTVATVSCVECYELAENSSSVAICRDGNWDFTIIQCLPSDENSCSNDALTEAPILTSSRCQNKEYECDSGQCIKENSVCDGLQDCIDSSDETLTLCQDIICSNTSYTCAYGACVHDRARCNGVVDCIDASDEKSCKNNTQEDRPRPTSRPTTTTTPSSEPSVDLPKLGSCQVPQVPTNGVYIQGGGDIVKEGEYCQEYSVLLLVCNRNFAPNLLQENASICLFGQWSPTPSTCARSCPSLTSSKTTKIKCKFMGVELQDCENPIAGTIAEISCKPLHEEPSLLLNPSRVCRDGSWDYPIFQCFPICGQKRPRGNSNIIQGLNAELDYPWQVGIYTSQKQLICGGAILSQKVILSAADWLSDDYGKVMAKEDYLIAAGKYYGTYDHPNDEHAQYSTVDAIHIPEQYIGWLKFFEADIAVIILTTALELSVSVQPVCIDTSDQFENQQLTSNSYGVVTGWGFSKEDAEPSEELKDFTVPFIPYRRCFDAVPKSFRRYITFDKICANYLEGVSVCRGESGGALVFPLQSNNRYYVRGIASVSPYSDGKCDYNQYRTYTLVSTYLDFIKNLMTLNRI